MASIDPATPVDPIFPARPSETLDKWLAGLSHDIGEWQRRRRYRSDLRRLLRVGPHMIADIGLTLEQARREIAKPVWR
jgi:uncharacterized protein YjiS (DUF1127 family)